MIKLINQLFDPAGYQFWLLIITIVVGAIAILSRPFSTYIKFVYPNAKYEAIGNPYVIQKNLNTIIENKSLSDFKEHINSKRDYNLKGENSYEIQRSLDNCLYKTIMMMKKDNSKKMQGFYDIFLEKIDMYLIKKELRNKLKNNSVSESSIEQAILPVTKKLLYNIKEFEKSKLANLLLDYGFHEDIAKELTQEKIDYLVIDNAIDKYILNRFLKVKVPYKCDKGKNDFIKIYIDILNIKFLLRCKQLGFDKNTSMKYYNGEGKEIAPWNYEQLAELTGVGQVISGLEGTSYFNILKNSIEEYNKEKTVQILENKLDSFYLKKIKEISTNNYSTIGPSIRYLVFKEFEIQNLKIIAKAVAENFSNEITKKLLILEDSL